MNECNNAPTPGHDLPENNSSPQDPPEDPSEDPPEELPQEALASLPCCCPKVMWVYLNVSSIYQFLLVVYSKKKLCDCGAHKERKWPKNQKIVI